ncbi:hypothetical protein H2203_005210 [Taxawa tesnikishii (nom. ined.)]|nr:hypothetical protein H2203_005210 [Dothideales sp. JES 119]
MDRPHDLSGVQASRGAEALVISCTFTAIAFTFLSLRVITRIAILKTFGFEDYMIVLAFTSSLALTVTICIEVTYGLGKHMATLAADQKMLLLKAFYASVPLYQCSLVLTKISILLQYHRLFVGLPVCRVIYAVGAVCITYALWSILSNICICTPVAYFWDQSIPKGRCLNKKAVWFTNASLNILTDIAILILPLPSLQRLRLPRRQKIGLMGVFALGGFVCLVSILRLKYLHQISISKDASWDNVAAAYWSSIEANVAIVTASLPTLKALISRHFPYLLGSSTGAPSSLQGPLPAHLGVSTNALHHVDDPCSSRYPTAVELRVTTIAHRRISMSEVHKA